MQQSCYWSQQKDKVTAVSSPLFSLDTAGRICTHVSPEVLLFPLLQFTGSTQTLHRPTSSHNQVNKAIHFLNCFMTVSGTARYCDQLLKTMVKLQLWLQSHFQWYYTSMTVDYWSHSKITMIVSIHGFKTTFECSIKRLLFECKR